jgi:cell wall-associated NlpC family hydrolase
VDRPNNIAASADFREPPATSGAKPPGRVINTWILSTLSALAVVFLSSCSGAPRHQAGPGGADADEPSRQDIVRFAKTFVGTPYRSGGTSYKGVDCSGLAYVVYRQFDIRLPRTSVDQSRVGVHVDRSGIEPADLLFFKTTRRGSISHVGIYIGKGKFIHASTGARTVRIDVLSDEYYRNRYVGARRLIEG